MVSITMLLKLYYGGLFAFHPLFKNPHRYTKYYYWSRFFFCILSGADPTSSRHPRR